MRLHARVAAALLAGCAGARTATAFADEPHGRGVPSEPLEVTVRGDGSRPDTQTSTRAASVVTETDVRAESPGSLADALRGRAGTSVQQTTPGQGTIYVRGLGGRELLVLVDGVRLNTAVFRSPNNAALGLVDPYSIYAAEVIRGPSSVLHGSDALGGVIALTTPLAPYAQGAPRTRLLVFESLSTNPFGTVSRLAVRHEAADWTVHVGATYTREGDVRPGEGTRTPVPSSYWGLQRSAGGAYEPDTSALQRGTGYERLAADWAARRRLGERAEIIVRAQVSERPRLFRYDELTPRFKRDFPARSESYLGPMVRAMTSATFVVRPRDAFFDSMLLTLAWQRIAETQLRRDFDETDLRLDPAASARKERTRSDALSARAELQARSADLSRGLVAGLEVVHDTITSRAETTSFATGTTGGAEPRYPSGSTMTQAGVFTQLEASAGDFRAHVGGRAALASLDIPGREGVDPALGGRALNPSHFDGALTVGVSYALHPDVRLVVNGGRAVRLPNVEDFAGLGTRAGGRFQVPNLGLSPEHAHGADFGVKIHREWLRADTFLFFLRLDDAVGLANTTVDGAARAPDGARYVRSENVARLDFYGVESDVRVGPERAGGVFARGVAMRFSEDTRPGVSAAERVLAPVQVTFGSWWQVSPEVRLEAFAYARLAQTRIANPDDNRIPAGGTPGFVTLHARASWLATPDLTARLALNNLTNTLALEHGSGYYLPGFSATASLEAKLLR